MTEPIALSDATVRHALPMLFAGQAQREAFVNEALARIDAALHPCVTEERASPPAASEDGDAYLVAASPSGDWQDHAHTIAVWQGQHWLFAQPVHGMTLLDGSTGERLVFDGTWQRQPAPASPSGGVTIDAQARSAIDAIIAALKIKGIFPAN